MNTFQTWYMYFKLHLFFIDFDFSQYMWYLHIRWLNTFHNWYVVKQVRSVAIYEQNISSLVMTVIFEEVKMVMNRNNFNWIIFVLNDKHNNQRYNDGHSVIPNTIVSFIHGLTQRRKASTFAEQLTWHRLRKWSQDHPTRRPAEKKG